MIVQVDSFSLPVKTSHDFCRKTYVSTVSESDEAFVWLIMDSYYGNWQDEQDEANSKGGARGILRNMWAS